MTALAIGGKNPLGGVESDIQLVGEIWKENSVTELESQTSQATRLDFKNDWIGDRRRWLLRRIARHINKYIVEL